MADFQAALAADRAVARGALVVAAPQLRDAGHVIDDVHAMLKDEAVHAGLMLGQFHENCTEPSARNPSFAVNRSPIPLLAIRAMTVHDILFLHSTPEWFGAYRERFGHLYAGGRRIDPLFRSLFDAAAERPRWEPAPEPVAP